jgi:hypothetical protein
MNRRKYLYTRKNWARSALKTFSIFTIKIFDGRGKIEYFCRNNLRKRKFLVITKFLGSMGNLLLYTKLSCELHRKVQKTVTLPEKLKWTAERGVLAC